MSIHVCAFLVSVDSFGRKSIFPRAHRDDSSLYRVKSSGHITMVHGSIYFLSISAVMIEFFKRVMVQLVSGISSFSVIVLICSNSFFSRRRSIFFERKKPSTRWMGMRYFVDISSMSAIWYGARRIFFVITHMISRISIFSGAVSRNPTTIPYSFHWRKGISTRHHGNRRHPSSSGTLYVRGWIPMECSDGMISIYK